MEYLEINLDSCQYFRFDPKDIMEFSIKKTDSRVFYFTDCTREVFWYSGIHIRINKRANNPDRLLRYSEFFNSDEWEVFERIIETNDINQLALDEDNGGFISWEESSDDFNPGQHSYIDSEGHLVIDIK